MGVGPGDPELLTLAAVDAIEKASLIAYPIAREGAEGMAAAIASKWITSRQKRLPLYLPMVLVKLVLPCSFHLKFHKVYFQTHK